MTVTGHDRASVAQLLDAAPALDGWTVYAEVPEQLAGGKSIVIEPRDPYQDHDTFTTIRTFLMVHVIIPRAAGPAMDQVDAGLAAVRAALTAIDSADLETTSIGTLVVGQATYTVGTLDVSVERVNT